MLPYDPASNSTPGSKRKRPAENNAHVTRARAPVPAGIHQQSRSAQATPHMLGPDVLLQAVEMSLDPALHAPPTPFDKPFPPTSSAPSSANFPHDPCFTQGLDNCQQPGGACHAATDPFQCSWEDFSKHCATSEPCNNPDCEDVAPCTATLNDCTDPVKCLGNICYDQSCVPNGHDSEVWCSEQCDEATRCASPCFSDECGVPACEAPCLDSRPALTQPHMAHPYVAHMAHMAPGHQFRQKDVLCHSESCAIPAFECIDPRCLNDFGVSGTHFHHDLRKFYDEFAHDTFGHAGSQFEGFHPSSSVLPPSQLPLAPSHRPYPYLDPSKQQLEPLESIARFNSQSNRSHTGLERDWSSEAVSMPELSSTLSSTPKSTASSDLRAAMTFSATQSHQHVCLWSASSAGLPSQPCGQVFRDASELHSHVERAHVDTLQREISDTVVNGYWCRWGGCARNQQGNPGTSFAARPKLKRHIQTHTLYKPFICRTCGVSMKTKDAMEKHLRTHTGERPYRCPVPLCAKVFATSTELKTHMVVHSGKKPHECPICGESFADSSNLSKHKKTHFLGMFRCPEPGCGARMKRWDQMRRHIVSQDHSKHLLEDMDAQREYKQRMEKEWKELPDSEKMLSDSGYMYAH